LINGFKKAVVLFEPGAEIPGSGPAVQCEKEQEYADEHERSVLLFHTARNCWFTIQSGLSSGRKRLSSQTFERTGIV